MLEKPFQLDVAVGISQWFGNSRAHIQIQLLELHFLRKSIFSEPSLNLVYGRTTRLYNTGTAACRALVSHTLHEAGSYSFPGNLH